MEFNDLPLIFFPPKKKGIKKKTISPSDDQESCLAIHLGHCFFLCNFGTFVFREVHLITL